PLPARRGSDPAGHLRHHRDRFARPRLRIRILGLRRRTRLRPRHRCAGPGRGHHDRPIDPPSRLLPRADAAPGRRCGMRQPLVALRRVRDRIDREFDRPLNIEALAAAEHMSAGHLSRRFKAAYGESPYSYLMTRRLEHDMALIRRGDLTITDICFDVCFSSLCTFSTRFSELVVVSARAYRDGVIAGEQRLPSILVKNALRPDRNRDVPPA